LNVKQVLEPVTAVSRMVSMKHPLRGLCGGDDAGPYGNHFMVGTDEEYAIENSVQAQLPAGAVLAYQYGGGGGFESPLLREPEAVLEDVLDEYVSIEAARDRYGVVLNGSVEALDLVIDWDKTKRLRSERNEAAAST
jgi:N-methylhydantoinase B